MTIFYFTATGNSLAVAKEIGGDLISIPQIVNSENLKYTDDIIGVVFPIFSTSTPKIVGEFLDKIQIEADYTFAIGTYGNIPGACMFNVQKQAIKNGYSFDYVNSILMVDNYLPMFEIENQIKKLPSKNIEKQLSNIIQDIRNRKHLQATSSFVMRALASILKKKTNHSKDSLKYIVNDDCIKCGVCVKLCPVKNIKLTDSIKFSDRCEGCLACIHLCPQNAIHLKNEKSNKRWRNPNVSIQEIIKANNSN